jgi:hypothetical protein
MIRASGLGGGRSSPSKEQSRLTSNLLTSNLFGWKTGHNHAGSEGKPLNRYILSPD